MRVILVIASFFISSMIFAQEFLSNNNDLDDLFAGEQEDNFLPVEQAFPSSVVATNDGFIEITWSTREGYYLYKHRISVSTTPADVLQLGELIFPKGKMKEDEYFGTVEVFYGEATVKVPVLSLPTIPFTLDIKSQGCAEAGLCYPPRTENMPMQATAFTNIATNISTKKTDKNSELSVKTATAANKKNTSKANFKTEEKELFETLSEGNYLLIIATFFLFGILLTFTPCVLPMIPILMSIIVAKHDLPRSKTFILSVYYVLGMALTYASIGVIVGAFGSSWNIPAKMQDPVTLSIIASLFVILSLSMFGFYELQIPSGLQNKLNNISNKQEGGTYIGAAIMGIISALVVSPCVAAPAAAAFIYISTTGDGVLGGAALFALAMGMGVPLLMVGAGGNKLLPKSGVWMNEVKYFFGVMLLALALWLLGRILPGTINLFLWAILFIVYGMHLFLIKISQDENSGQIRKAFGFIFVLYGSLMFIGAMGGHSNPLQPLANMNMNKSSPSSVQVAQAIKFSPANDLAALNSHLSKAKGENKPLMLDFYADWCISCKVMEHEVFTDPKVANLMEQFILLQADVTDNTETHQALLNHYGLFGPPSILFFNKNGEEITEYRLQGETTADQFAQLLQVILNQS